MHAKSRTQDSPCQRPWGASWSRLQDNPFWLCHPMWAGLSLPHRVSVRPLSAPLLSPDRPECSLEAGDAREGRVGPWGSSGQGGGWGTALRVVGHRMDGVSWGGVPQGLGCFGGEAAVGRGQSERLQLRVLAAF